MMSSNASAPRRAVLASLLSVPLAAHASLAGTTETSANQEMGPARVKDANRATRYRSIRVDGVNIFYREAGPANAPVLLLLHGYPSSSRMFESLFPLLCDQYRLVAPDLKLHCRALRASVCGAVGLVSSPRMPELW